MSNDTTAQLDANQVVAFNLAVARADRGWTQAEATERLAEHLGEAWSVASWSAAERSVTGSRVREFTAEEIAALAQTFNLPIAWFFLPPAGRGNGGSLSSTRTSVRYGASELHFLDALSALFPADVSEMAAEIERRAVLQVEGDTDAERKRTAMRVLRDHSIAWVRQLGDRHPLPADRPGVSGLGDQMRHTADAVDLLLRISGEAPPERPVPEWDTEEFRKRADRKHGLVETDEEAHDPTGSSGDEREDER